jgi:A/G-specific adenine glycosylase
MLILRDKKGRVLLERRPPAGIWGGLWSLPADDAGPPFEQRFSFAEAGFKTLPVIEHTLTHMHMRITPLAGTAAALKNGVECSRQQSWFGASEWSALGLPAPVRQLLETHIGDNSNG